VQLASSKPGISNFYVSKAPKESPMREQEGREIVLAGLFTALAFVIPYLFHMLGLGKIFLPMFLPIAVAGFLVSWRIAALIGLIAPLLSGLLTGMPPFYPPIAPLMALEGVFLGATISLLYRQYYWPWYCALAVADLGERLISGAGMYVMAEWFHLPGVAFSIIGTLWGVPGVVLQFIFVPIFLGLFEKRYGFSPRSSGERR
jgi:hypothetical protein